MTKLRWTRFLLIVSLCAAPCSAQFHASAAGTVPVVLLSDLHFDPLYDPAKFDRLRSSPAADWQQIFAARSTPAQMQDWLKLNAACKLVRGVDTSWPLLQSSLAAVKAASPHALFVTVSGDLLAHEMECRYKVLLPKATATEIATFAEKTVAYVALQLHLAFPKTPVFIAMGNNDSGCGDYMESEHSEFLRDTAESLAQDVLSDADRKALRSFSDQGDYSIALPAPIVRGRLLVLQDIFQARTYLGCNGKPNPAGPAAQIAWLRAELTSARERHEQVWVMAHIPPGVDVYNTFAKRLDVCAGAAPVMFLADDRMVDVLEEFADNIRLAIFAHTHFDEMKLLRGKIPAKLVPSISPINGNQPSFTLAEVEEKTATLRDYRIVAAGDHTGVATQWTEEYRYSTMYHQPAYGPTELTTLLNAFTADRDGIAQASTDYQQNASAGGGKGSLALHFLWPGYSCEMGNDTEKSYRECICRKPDATRPQ